MPLSPPKRQVSDTENKLRLLCCLNSLGAVTEVQLWPFVASLELMEYIPMQLLLHELLAGGDVEVGTLALHQQLFLTDQGKKTLHLFMGRVMPSDVERIAQAAPAYRAGLLQRSQVRAVYEQAQPGDYRVLLSLRDGDVPTFSLHLQTPSRDFAAQAIHAFETQAASILQYLYNLDTASFATGIKAVDATENSPTVTQHSAHEYTLTVPFSFAEGAITLALLLPSHQQADAYRQAFLHAEFAAACTQTIVQLLHTNKQEP